jgi:hypothetical protein
VELKVFSVYDVKAGAYIQPFFMPTTALALRLFADCVADPSHAFCKHPSDYVLFELGSYDDNRGVFLNSPAPISLGVGSEFVVRDLKPTA